MNSALRVTRPFAALMIGMTFTALATVLALTVRDMAQSKEPSVSSGATTQPASQTSQPTTRPVILYENLASNPMQIDSSQTPNARVLEHVGRAKNIEAEILVLSIQEITERDAWRTFVKTWGVAETKDTIAVVCVLRNQTDEIIVAGVPYISGLSHLHKRWADSVLPDSTIKMFGYGDGPQTSYHFQPYVEKEDAFIIQSRYANWENKLVCVWMVPALKTKFRIVFPPPANEMLGHSMPRQELTVELTAAPRLPSTVP